MKKHTHTNNGTYLFHYNFIKGKNNNIILLNTNVKSQTILQ